MSSEEQNKQQQQSDSNNNQQQSPQETYYQRKKNWVSGVDNDTLLLLGVAGAIGLGAIAAYPTIKDFINNFTSRMQQQQPNGNGEAAYIPPTPPIIQNGNGQGQQQLPPPLPQTVEEPEIKPQEAAPQQPKFQDDDDDDDGTFYESELKKRQRLLGKRAIGTKYESPFGKDIGGLG